MAPPAVKAARTVRSISGLGGIGKTQLAIEYAYRYAHEYEAVLWVQATSREVLVSDFASLAQTLDLPDKREKDQLRIIREVKHWLQEHSTWLLILDNADDLNVIVDFLPRAVGGATLITTRSQVTGKIARRIAVEKMEMSEGIRFVLRRAKVLEEDEPLEKVSSASRIAAQHLVEELGGLPLALDQAGAYIEETGCNFLEYLDLYGQHRLMLLKRESSMPDEYPHTVASTWTLSFFQVEQANTIAQLCKQYQLIGEEAGRLFYEAATYLRQRARYQEAESLYQHALHIREQQLGPEHPHAAYPLNGLAILYDEQGKYIEAEPLYLRALRIREQQLGPRHPLVAYSLYGLANFYYEQSQYEQAEPLYLRAWHIREQQLGPEHPQLAYPLNGLANLYGEQGKYAQAEPLYLQALHIREQSLGLEHLEMATTLQDFAAFQEIRGNQQDACSLYLRALNIREHVLGTQHPKTIQIRTRLIALRHALGQYEDEPPPNPQS